MLGLQPRHLSWHSVSRCPRSRDSLFRDASSVDASSRGLEIHEIKIPDTMYRDTSSGQSLNRKACTPIENCTICHDFHLHRRANVCAGGIEAPLPPSPFPIPFSSWIQSLSNKDDFVLVSYFSSVQFTWFAQILCRLWMTSSRIRSCRWWGKWWWDPTPSWTTATPSRTSRSWPSKGGTTTAFQKKAPQQKLRQH